MLISKSYKIRKADHMPAELLEEMLQFIENNLPSDTDSCEIRFKTKFILTELLTNAIKHTDSSDVNLEIEVTSKHIKLIKTDNGHPFVLPQVKNKQFKNALVITADVMHTLYGMEREGRFYFYCHENHKPAINLQHDFPEHFGLLIITKASNEFYYASNQSTPVNTFTATVSF